MSYSSQTTHYGLPLPTGSDKSSWLDTNQAFETIDAAIYAATQASGGSGAAIEQLQTDVSGLTTALATTNTNLAQETANRTAADGTLTSRIATAESNINSNAQDIATLETEHSTEIATLNSLLDDLRFVTLTPTAHANLSKTGMSGSDVPNVIINAEQIQIGNFHIKNATSSSITLTNGIATSAGNYLIPLFYLPASVVSQMAKNFFAVMEDKTPYVVGRFWQMVYTSSASGRHWYSNMSFSAMRNGTAVYFGITNDSATYDFPAERQFLLTVTTVTHGFRHLPNDIVE